MEVYINDFDDLGNGITKINDKVCFVKRALPNETVKINLIKNNKNYSVGEIVKIITKSKYRENPICKYYNKCGGCNFLHQNNYEEINFKKKRVLKYFKKLDNFYETINYHYRNKIVLHAKQGIIGLYQEKTNDIIQIDYCYLVHNKINDLILVIKENIDNKFIGDITIRINTKEEIILSIEGNYKNIAKLKENNLIDNLIYNDKVLKGNNYFYEYVLNYKFKVHYKSFFQVNILGLKCIFKVLQEFLQDKKINIALDLYSGTSVLGIIMSKYIKKVISVEVNTNATSDALDNLKINSISNLEVINGLVEDNIDKFNDIDLVLVDPARRGLDKKTISYLKIIKSNYLIYIACGIDALKRDIELLKDLYQIDNIYGIDMFPRTNNQETICIMSLK